MNLKKKSGCQQRQLEKFLKKDPLERTNLIFSEEGIHVFIPKKIVKTNVYTHVSKYNKMTEYVYYSKRLTMNYASNSKLPNNER